MSAAADGLQIWLQLAAFGATDVLRRVAVQLRRNLKIAADCAETLAICGKTVIDAQTDVGEARAPNAYDCLEAELREAQVDFGEVAEGVVDAVGVFRETVKRLRRSEFVPEVEPFYEALIALRGTRGRVPTCHSRARRCTFSTSQSGTFIPRCSQSLPCG